MRFFWLREAVDNSVDTLENLWKMWIIVDKPVDNLLKSCENYAKRVIFLFYLEKSLIYKKIAMKENFHF
jgi:hypothetical protein